MISVARYNQIYDSLRRSKRWGTDSSILRFAALTLVSTDLADPGEVVREVADRLKTAAGGFSPMASDLRQAVAAMLIRRKLDPEVVVIRVREALDLFKRHKLRKGGAHPFLAALLLVLDSQGGEVPEETISRLKEIIDRWKTDHYFLTGVDDYPMAAMHASRGGRVETLAVEVETIYETLRRRRFSRGNPLQLVSHLLAFSEYGSHKAADRFIRMAAGLRSRGQRIWQSQYDEVALLVLSGVRVDHAAAKVILLRDELRAHKPKPQASIAFSIAAGLVLAEQAAKTSSLRGARAAANLRAVQALIEAQQAAMVACMIATSNAATAAATR